MSKSNGTNGDIDDGRCFVLTSRDRMRTSSNWIIFLRVTGPWRGALMFSLICVWINDWVNNREVGDFRRYGAAVLTRFFLREAVPLVQSLKFRVVLISLADTYSIVTSHECHFVSNRRSLDCLFNNLFGLTSKKASKFCITAPLCRESIGHWWIPSNVESVSMSSRLHEYTKLRTHTFSRQHQGQMNIQELCTSHDSFLISKYSNSWGLIQSKDDVPSAQEIPLLR